MVYACIACQPRCIVLDGSDWSIVDANNASARRVPAVVPGTVPDALHAAGLIDDAEYGYTIFVRMCVYVFQ